MITNNIRDVKYSLSCSPEQNIYRQDLIKELKSLISRPDLNQEVIKTLQKLRWIVPVEDRKVAKLFNAVLEVHNIPTKQVHPYNIDPLSQAKFKYLLDYHPPSFLIPATHLELDFQKETLMVKATLTIQRNHQKPNKNLILHGEMLHPISARLNGQELFHLKDGVQFTSNRLMIPAALLPRDEKFTIETVVTQQLINPQLDNNGIRKKGDWILSLCEPVEFKRITYFIDRPDNPTQFTVEASLDTKQYPTFLTNGTLVERQEESEERYRVTYEMDYPMPSYLFGCAAGNYVCMKDTHTTKSGREIRLELYCKPGDENRVAWIFDTAKSSMEWFEERIALEFTQDIFKFVLVDYGVCSGMENEGLIFLETNLMTKCKDLSTQGVYYAIRTVAHEIYHHRSGNNPTIPSMFYRAFKEGLTRYLDSKYMSEKISGRMDTFMRARRLDIFHPALTLTSHYFREMPLVSQQADEKYNYNQPGDSYSMGREFFVMLELIFGEEILFEAFHRFFIRYEGQAAAYDELFAIIQEILNEQNLPPFNFEQFSLWLFEKTLPTMHVSMEYSPFYQRAVVQVTQFISENKVFTVPFVIGFLDEEGNEIMPSQKFVLTEPSQKLVFENISKRPVLSIFRGISSPVKWQYSGFNLKDLVALIRHDTDEFNRFRAMREFWNAAMNLEHLNENSFLSNPLKEAEAFCETTLCTIILNHEISPYLKAKFLKSCYFEANFKVSGPLLMYNFCHTHRDLFLDLLDVPTKENETLEETTGRRKLQRIVGLLLIRTEIYFGIGPSSIISEKIKHLAENSPFEKDKAYFSKLL